MKKLICNPRFLLSLFMIFGLCLLLGIIVFSPAQGPVIGYKLALVVLAAIVGMAFDYLAFPYALPSGYLDRDWRKNPDATGPDGKPDYPVAEGCILPFCASLTRRAVIIFGFVIAVAVGL
ncbi:putative holin [Desulfovibrio sp. ZJ200]|uniref:putative holin n=1 Tax=Desulfovibrio sp. ZJ200 TaxID=2709792 RepID=UPI0013EB5732|nr:putative holin [Desulfovibrio sp. ZJ200]